MPRTRTIAISGAVQPVVVSDKGQPHHTSAPQFFLLPTFNFHNMPFAIQTVEAITNGWRHAPKPMTDINVTTTYGLVKDVLENLRRF